MLIPWLHSLHGLGRPGFVLSLNRIRSLVAGYAAEIRPNPGLAAPFRQAAAGAVFQAAYVVARKSLYFSPSGPAGISHLAINRAECKLSGWFKIIPHPLKPGKTIFIFDSCQEKPQQASRQPAMSLNENFMSLYFFLVKSGAGNFSVRSVPVGECARDVNGANWTKASQLLFPSEIEEERWVAFLKEQIG
ncbi:MAG: hypothetical protein MUC35_01150 [Candidatus Margulisbacteria bacterium]|jgi:hypothetical protein|nr:hypothetical protein [Candidatus Margulisiibacteriota bacterium]